VLTLHTVVRNLHTGDEGIIVAFDGDMAMVELFDDGDRYPIPLQSLVRTEEFFGTIAFDKDLTNKFAKKSKAVQKQVQQNEPKTVAAFVPTHAPLPKGEAQNTGLHLAFDLQNDIYLIYLVNDTNFSFTISVELILNEASALDFKHHIAAHDYFPIGEMPHSALNNSPKIKISAPALKIEIEHALRPKFFYNAPKTLAICPKAMPVWTIKERLAAQDDPTALKERAAQDKVTAVFTKPKNPFLQKHQSIILAEFDNELDLHHDILLKGKKYEVADILPKQMEAFEHYLLRAINLNVPRVYIIHGKGTGRLRTEIHKSLAKNKYVSRFNNDYHPKYGHGATEVVIND
jgi:Smr domain